MGFDRPTRTVDYADLKRETEHGPRLLAFRILDFLPREDGDFLDRATGRPTDVWPVVADCMIIDGPNAGQLYRSKVYRYAITNALRGAASNEPTPTTYPGQNLAIKAERAKGKGQSRDTVYGNEPDDDELATIEREFARFGGWDGPTAAQRARAAENGADAPATAGRPAAAATGPAATTPAATPAAPAQAGGSGARRPFGNRTA
jgi:hypothetical protein